MAQAASVGNETRRTVLAYSVEGAPPRPICRIYCNVSWTMDRRYLYVHLPGTSQHSNFGETSFCPYNLPIPFHRSQAPV
jgi:hypothetical protein